MGDDIHLNGITRKELLQLHDEIEKMIECAWCVKGGLSEVLES